MNNISLKKATLKNFKEIAELEKSANSKTYSARVNENEIKNFIKDEFVFLIKHKRRSNFIGLIAYKILKGKIIHINGLIINPEDRRKGFARQAMSLLLKKIKKYYKIELVVHPHNNPALLLYLSLGLALLHE